MKKKYIIFIVIIALAIILFVPIPTGPYKDGGSREYAALTYKVIKWNKLIDEQTTYKKTCIYWLPNNFKTIDELWKNQNTQDNKDLLKTVSSDFIRIGSSSDSLFNISNFENYKWLMISSVRHIPVIRITSIESLTAFMSENSGIDFEHGWDSAPSFKNYVLKYNKAYFENNVLVIAYIQEGSGSIRHELINKSINNGTMQFEIKSIIPKTGTDDMADWLGVFEISKNELKDNVKIDAILT